MLKSIETISRNVGIKMHLLKKTYKIIIHEGFFALFHKFLLWKKYKSFVKQISQKYWKKAIILGEKLILRYPNEIECYQLLAECYRELGQNNLANLTLKKGLHLYMPLEKIVDCIRKGFNNQTISFSEYCYLGGEQNLGCIEHILKDIEDEKKYLTKISFMSSNEKERHFYTKIYPRFQSIKTITPRVVQYQELTSGNLLLITMEKIQATNLYQIEEIINKVMNASKIISSIKYTEVSNLLPKPDFDKDFQLFHSYLIDHPICALHSFIAIHKREANEQLFYLMSKRMQELNYSVKSKSLIKRLENAILANRLYTHISPELHYSLQHGDFDTHNILIEETSSKLYIIDWGNMRIGPEWVDIAGFFGLSKIRFQVINNQFLLNDAFSGHLEPIEKLFFIYTLIVTWFVVFTVEEFNEKIEDYLRPAVLSIESMILELS
ncbi:phosphotransferase [Heyndrickxia oleronia]|uniref:phosphotransferase n=1 Tax=Heyndrickxia oleronia TaxID=38875 RepID=UPI002431D02B|nr:phosphotransferase [Heyndrickxia oleronia]MCI1590690.1 aminoglycoside phosphotransferase family protein [Heyndrickxia oleronia]MCI1612121.1 aminoglycoside phosphotransferase family protein [Heyndrickxia oleronia]MCI1759830.1 aminoglycoside phosphotransferase family protein [Heyndrickxia oleronia]